MNLFHTTVLLVFLASIFSTQWDRSKEADRKVHVPLRLRIAYWSLCGLVMMATGSFGFVLLPVSVVMSVVGTQRLGPEGAWAALVVLGGLGASLLRRAQAVQLLVIAYGAVGALGVVWGVLERLGWGTTAREN